MSLRPPTPSKILLVDDNPHGLIARALLLRDLGHEVETALSGEEGWEAFQCSHFDLVVTDYRMGKMDGLELIRKIRAAETPARIIMLSGYVGKMGMTEATTGADEVLVKSNKEVPELLRAVKKLLHHPPRRKASTAASRALKRRAQAGE
jgi:two-component system chemotaxis sensor kinase CheA/two-component system sensor histidine kinase and response regulator WspE